MRAGRGWPNPGDNIGHGIPVSRLGGVSSPTFEPVLTHAATCDRAHVRCNDFLP